MEIEFYSQNGKLAFLATPLGTYRINIRASSIAPGKPEIDLILDLILESFSLAYGGGTTSANVSKSVCFRKRMHNFQCNISVECDTTHQPCISENQVTTTSTGNAFVFLIHNR